MVTIRECNTDDEILGTLAVAGQLYSLESEQYLAFVREMMDTDYRLIALYNESNTPVAVVGFRVGRRLYCGKYLHVDNLIVDQTSRTSGYALQLMAWLEDEAKRLQCDTLLADSYIENHAAHRLFLKGGYHIRGFHLKKTLQPYKTPY